MGLDHSPPSHLHRYLHSVFRRVRSERRKKEILQREHRESIQRPPDGHRPHRRHHVHRRHPHQLQDHLCQQERRSGQQPWEDHGALL